MAAAKLYEDYYQSDSTARKIKTSQNNNVYKNTRKSKKTSVAKSASYVLPSILAIFVMMLVITIRYTIINEKNLQTISLKSDLEKVESNLFSSKIAVEQNTDLTKIEAYAKQKLGMQKPTKNQIIYVDTSENTSVVEMAKDKSIFEGVKSNILNFINNIF